MQNNWWGLAEKFIGWPKYFHRMWPNEVYFPIKFLLWSTYCFHWCYHRAWTSLVKTSSAEDRTLSYKLFSTPIYESQLKVDKLTKILTLNATKWSLFFNLLSWAVNIPLLLMWQKKNQQQIWCHQIKFSAHSCILKSL